MLLSFRKLSKLMCENAPQFLKFRVVLVTGASASSSGLLRPSIPTPPARPQGGRPVWRGDAGGDERHRSLRLEMRLGLRTDEGAAR